MLSNTEINLLVDCINLKLNILSSAYESEAKEDLIRLRDK